MTDKTRRTIRIKWVRSGIGFTSHQKGMVRSLGLSRLNQVVERPDTPQIRGLVASIPHLVEVVEGPATPARVSVPEYTILPPEPKPAKVSAAVEAEPVEAVNVPTGAVEVAEAMGEPAPPAELEKPAREVAPAAKADKAKKAAKSAAAEKKKVAKAEEGKKTKAASSKTSKSTKSSKK